MQLSYISEYSYAKGNQISSLLPEHRMAIVESAQYLEYKLRFTQSAKMIYFPDL